MRICILTPRFPFPENGGDVLRINNIARYLKEQNHQLILVSFTQGKPDILQAYQLYDEVICVPQHKLLSILYTMVFMLIGRPLQCGYYFSFRMRHCIKKVQSMNPDLYISHLLRMTPYLDNNLYSRSIIEMTDALSKTYALSIQSSNVSFKRLVYAIEYNKIKRYEQYVIKRFPKVVLVSNPDVKYLTQNDTNNSSVVCLTNGVQTADKPSTIYNPNKICFVGNMRTIQNQEAVLYFTEKVLPLIQAKAPNVVFYIVGAQPPQCIQQLAQDNHIIVTGFVSQVERVLEDACLAVAPVHIAAGIQNKVLVAMGQRIPVVLTPLIATAIPELKDGTNCFIRQNETNFAQACIDLMTQPDLRNQLAQASYEMVQQNYDWNNRLNGYENLSIVE